MTSPLRRSKKGILKLRVIRPGNSIPASIHTGPAHIAKTQFEAIRDAARPAAQPPGRNIPCPFIKLRRKRGDGSETMECAFVPISLLVHPGRHAPGPQQTTWLSHRLAWPTPLVKALSQCRQFSPRFLPRCAGQPPQKSRPRPGRSGVCFGGFRVAKRIFRKISKDDRKPGERWRGT